VVEHPIPSRLAAIGSIMRVDATTVEVVTAMRAAGIRPILLKGPSIARWLYESKEDRPYTDSDVLVSPDHLAAAESVLRELGFTPVASQSGVDRKLRPLHALPWMPPTHLGAVVDLHQSIGDVKGAPAAVWAALSRDTDEIRVNGVAIEVFGVPARALLVAVHAAHHSGLSPAALEDLRRAIAVVSFDDWRRAAALATEIDGREELAYGLGLVPEGAALRRGLGLGGDPGADALLRQAGTPPLARGVNWILEAPSGRARMRRAVVALFPSPPEMRDWTPLARRGAMGLALAYVWRPVWVLWRLPRGWLAVRRARRSR
jgi:hypothetical protein